MKTPSNINQWLKSQPPMSPPKDDFAAIYQQLDKPKTLNRLIYAWSVAAGIALMTIGVSFFYHHTPVSETSLNKAAIIQLQQQVSQLEQQLLTNDTAIVSNPGSAQLENEVMLEQWLDHLNKRLSESHNTQQKQSLLQAKLSVLQNLNPKNPTIELI